MPTMVTRGAASAKAFGFTPNTQYRISRSVRFRASASAYFTRTPSGATNRQIATYSVWVKRGLLGSASYYIYDEGNWNGGSPTAELPIVFSADQLTFYQWNGTAVDWQLTTTQVFRDPSAWYHIVIAVDTTQATASNRVKIYVNGSQVTALSVATYPSLNANTGINTAVAKSVGRWQAGAARYFDGYITEFNFIDGQALTPSSFGQNNPATGVWEPIRYGGSYGTNGFYLNFSDNSAATAAAIGKDYSGNGNNWTPNNISVTAGTTYDSMIDTPTPYDDGGNGRGNYCTMNAAGSKFNTSDISVNYSNGNLQTNSSGTGTSNACGTIGVNSGKFYYEAYCNGNSGSGNIIIGLNAATTAYIGPVGIRNNGNYDNASILTGAGFTYTTGDTVSVAFDASARTTIFYKNGVQQFTGNMPGNLIDMTPWTQMNGSADSIIWNFGQRPFSYTPPSGYKALNTFNLPAPSIVAGNVYMNATTYTGNGGTQSVVNSGGIQPDLVWAKGRSVAYSNGLYDRVRGPNTFLNSGTTNGDITNDVDGYLSAFNSNGFTLSPGATSSNTWNQNAATYVAWQWRAGNSAGSTNTSGSITSTVSASTTAGFSIVAYTGTGSNATVGHGLGAVPAMIIVKWRGGTSNWAVGHQNLTNWNWYLRLNTTDAQTGDATVFTSTPSSTVISIGTNALVNGNTNGYIAYCWTAISGFSAFGSYTGNGSADGPFVYCGFRPRYLLVKLASTATTSWPIFDSARDTYNAEQSALFADLNNAEASSSTYAIDFLANGFKVRATNATWNFNGGTFIYAAFAENPFKYALAR